VARLVAQDRAGGGDVGTHVGLVMVPLRRIRLGRFVELLPRYDPYGDVHAVNAAVRCDEFLVGKSISRRGVEESAGRGLGLFQDQGEHLGDVLGVGRTDERLALGRQDDFATAGHGPVDREVPAAVRLQGDLARSGDVRGHHAGDGGPVLGGE